MGRGRWWGVGLGVGLLMLGGGWDCGGVPPPALECAAGEGAGCEEDPPVPGCEVGARRVCGARDADVQVCGARGVWGPCEAVTPVPAPTACVRTEGAERACGDGRDGDCDGLVDCADPDCEADACGTNGRVCGGAVCVCPGGTLEEACGDGQDNDCDGQVDCEDSDCGASTCGAHGQRCAGAACACPGGATEDVCGDGQDNDCDGLVDCADPDCQGRTCRAAVGVCDQEEVCGAGVCPADRRVGGDVVCRPSRGVCDVAERCDGVGTGCPGDGKVAAGTVCHASTGGCDPAETCDGTGVTCPADRYLAAGQVCRAAVGDCDSAARCSGTSAVCPANGSQRERCDDGKVCTTDTCGADGWCRHIPTGACY